MDSITKMIELKNLLEELEGKDKATPEQLTRMFNLHNFFNPKKPEYSKHCTSCVARVYRNVKAIMHQLENR